MAKHDLRSVDALLSGLPTALENAEPFAAVPLFITQMKWLAPDVGISLIERVTARAHPSTWGFTDARLDSWEPSVADGAFEAVRALPTCDARTELLMRMPRRLSPTDNEEVLDQLVSGSFAEMVWDPHTKPFSHTELIHSFVRGLPETLRHQWLKARLARANRGVATELSIRGAVGCLDETTLQGWRSQLEHGEQNGADTPIDFWWIAPMLPVDLRSAALHAIRSQPDPSVRASRLVRFDEELTADERVEVVMTPSFTPKYHLQQVAHHLPHVPAEVRDYWLKRVLAMESEFDRQFCLLWLLPSLQGAARQRAIDEILAYIEEDPSFCASKDRWDLVAAERLKTFLLRLANDPYGWNRDGLILHIWKERSRLLADSCFEALLDEVTGLPGDAQLEIATALTPWLVERTFGAWPLAVSELTVPVSTEAPNALYAIARVLKADDATADGSNTPASDKDSNQLSE